MVIYFIMVLRERLELSRLAAVDPKSTVPTNYTTQANLRLRNPLCCVRILFLSITLLSPFLKGQHNSTLLYFGYTKLRLRTSVL